MAIDIPANHMETARRMFADGKVYFDWIQKIGFDTHEQVERQKEELRAAMNADPDSIPAWAETFKRLRAEAEGVAV